MKRLKIYRSVTLGLMMMLSLVGFNQEYYVKQVVTGNSGRFETMPPFLDYVSLQTYNPVSQVSDLFGTIFTQSVQDILIVGKYAYVTAQDSIAKYDLNTLERVTAVADSGVNKLGVYNGFLVISKQYPVAHYFATIRDTGDLSLVSNIGGISGDCMEIISVADSVYLAVNGGWMGTDGKIAVIDPNTWTLVREIQLGTDAVGIVNLYLYNGQILSVNKTPYGAPEQGSITMYDPVTATFKNYLFGVTMGYGVELSDSNLFVMMNEGIGIIHLPTMEIADTSRIPDPGSAGFIYITSAAFDTINDRFYVNIGDYLSPGYCLVANLAGDSITSYATGISTEAIAIDYRETVVGIPEPEADPGSIVQSLYPNPAYEWIHVSVKSDISVNEITIFDLSGKAIKRKVPIGTNAGSHRIDVSNLPAGLYFLAVSASTGSATQKFVKQ
ncbi:MAG: T9SS type A sorting domain-containing protein [Bacteroidales bacterium]|nr:T9SS type A sorting domain-containing protein [Bacteroidales bacterium]